MTDELDLKGLVPATLLPLTSDAQIDEPALRSYVRWLLRFDGLKALAVNMDTGEGPHLSRDEKRRVLEIYADDVVCGHGATCTEIDADLLFYCRSRGIPVDEARAMLTESFVGEAVEKIEDEDVREAIETLAIGWLRAG